MNKSWERNWKLPPARLWNGAAGARRAAALPKRQVSLLQTSGRRRCAFRRLNNEPLKRFGTPCRGQGLQLCVNAFSQWTFLKLSLIKSWKRGTGKTSHIAKINPEDLYSNLTIRLSVPDARHLNVRSCSPPRFVVDLPGTLDFQPLNRADKPAG